jgi:uncharacterized delta-60 repeat protein
MGIHVRRLLIEAAAAISCAGITAAPAAAQSGDGFFLSRFSSAGEVDPSFQSQSWYFSVPYDGGYATGAAKDQSNRIVVVGAQGGRFAVGRFNADGTPDFSFGSAGQAFATFAGGGEGRAVAVRQDGSILVAGTAWTSNGLGTFGVACFTATGQHCSGWSFSTLQTAFLYEVGECTAIAVAADNSFVVAGWLKGPGFRNEMFALARYKPWGALDVTFGQGGRLVLDKAPAPEATQLDDWNYEKFNAVRFDSSDRILAAGEFSSPGQVRRMVLMRFFGNGAVDSGFGQGGMVTAGSCSWAWGCFRDAIAYSIDVDSAGRIVLGGGSTKDPTFIDLPVDLALARFLTTGQLDTTFGVGGMVRTSLGVPSIIQAIKVTGDKLYVAGQTGGGGEAFIGRYDAAGALDSSFGGNGILIGNPCGSGWGVGFAVVLQSFAVGIPGTYIRKPVLVGACVLP